MKQQIIEAYSINLDLLERLLTPEEFQAHCTEQLEHLLKVNAIRRLLKGNAIKTRLVARKVQAAAQKESISAADFEAIVQDGISNYIDSQGGTAKKWRPVVEGYLRPQYDIVPGGEI